MSSGTFRVKYVPRALEKDINHPLLRSNGMILLRVLSATSANRFLDMFAKYLSLALVGTMMPLTQALPTDASEEGSNDRIPAGKSALVRDGKSDSPIDHTLCHSLISQPQPPSTSTTPSSQVYRLQRRTIILNSNSAGPGPIYSTVKKETRKRCANIRASRRRT